ncbi:hypothetical protein CCYN49044_200068 [Capnocytophaga cynodegmi]|uniref:Uncharacterized protein n=1 Tax=Capnocytophaga cynodegmi TaxID=28189 RepID=A0A0B7HDU2_9FLAO|nr:hypothetical protein CCYN74_100068 [Capnocytophaga cynodegmi]CEN37876.1 hypothetical protein CCYN49044_200068 [Capnocytophaga cynodegmi]
MLILQSKQKTPQELGKIILKIYFWLREEIKVAKNKDSS